MPEKLIQPLAKKSIIKSFNRITNKYDQAAIMQQEVGNRLIERLDYMRLQPASILELGAGTGHCTRLLRKRFPKARLVAVDIAENMLRKNKQGKKWLSRERFVCADIEQLPFLKQSFDLIITNLSLHWLTDLSKGIVEIARLLKPEGLLLFSLLGPDTFKELRASWYGVDEYPHVHDFVDLHDIGDALMQARLLDPVMDMEMLTFTYADSMSLFADLKNSGLKNVLQQRRQSLLGKQRWQRFLYQYEKCRDQNNQLPISYEIIYGHAWGSVMTARQGNEIEIPISALKKRK